MQRIDGKSRGLPNDGDGPPAPNGIGSHATGKSMT